MVEREKSSRYASARMIISDINEKMIASAIVPEKGIDGKVIPNAMAIMAPKEAPEETPRVEPSARGFLSNPCMAAPLSDNAAPTNATQITRGMRTDNMMEEAK